MTTTATLQTAPDTDALLGSISALLEAAQVETALPSRKTRRKRPAKPKSAVKKLSVLMPVYNERHTLEEIVARVLKTPIEIDLEIVAVDDCSTDGSPEVLEALAKLDKRVKVVYHVENRGKGTAVRTAIEHMTGDVAVVQDADLEYNPRELPRLLVPIAAGRADAVFGSRFAGSMRRVHRFWHGLANRGLTAACNMLNDLDLTDMETCYKMVRADVLRQLVLESSTFTFEVELTTRLAQWGARIWEVPISYSSRSVDEGKKIRPVDGLKALWEMVRCRFLKTRFTHHSGLYILKSVARASRYNRWLIEQCRPYLGRRVLEAGAGIGNLSTLLLDRERLVLVDHEPMYVQQLAERFRGRRNVRAVEADLTKQAHYERFKGEKLDTVVCMNVLEHISADEKVLRAFRRTLSPGGHCIIVVPAGPKLFTPLDAELGHFRRYTEEELRRKMESVGFEVVFASRSCKLGTLGWWFNGRVLRRRDLSPRQMIWFDRLWPAAKHLDPLLPLPGMSLMMVGRK